MVASASTQETQRAELHKAIWGIVARWQGLRSQIDAIVADLEV